MGYKTVGSIIRQSQARKAHGRRYRCVACKERGREQIAATPSEAWAHQTISHGTPWCRNQTDFVNNIDGSGAKANWVEVIESDSV